MPRAARKTVNRLFTCVFPATRTPDQPGRHKSSKQHESSSAMELTQTHPSRLKIITMLLDRGADVNVKRKDGRTPYALAILSGQKEVASLLKSHGANTDLSALDQFVEATANAYAGQHLTAQPSISASPEYAHLVPHLAAVHNTAAVRGLLAAGLPVNARGEHGGTALHWACWKG